MKEYDDESEENEKEEKEEKEKFIKQEKQEKKDKEIKKEKEVKKESTVNNEKEIKNEKNLSKNLLDQKLKEQKREEEEINRNLFYNKGKLKQNEYYSDPQRMNKFLSQRHLYDHKREKKDPILKFTNRVYFGSYSSFY